MMNNCVLMGRLTADPEVIQTNSADRKGIRFDLAVERPYKKQDGTKDTDFLNCVSWAPGTVKFLESYAKKGDMIAVIAEAQTNSYQDKNGNNVRTVRFNVSSATIASSPNRNNNANQAPQQTAPQQSFAQPQAQAYQQQPYQQQAYQQQAPVQPQQQAYGGFDDMEEFLNG
jgi:single-strand DNA-binding protein